MKTVEIENQKYTVNDNEFNKFIIDKYCNLNILLKLGEFERVVSLLCEFSNIKNCVVFNPTHGGFIPISCSKKFETVYISGVIPEHINQNISDRGITNITNTTHTTNITGFQGDMVVFAEDIKDIDYSVIRKHTPILLTTREKEFESLYHTIYELSGTNLCLYIPAGKYDDFYKNLFYYIDGNKLTYDNMINLCIMVKNGGAQFEEMLLKNIHLIDKWTILDTGSTDSTIEIINKVLVGKKRGTLYQEQFINFNFRDSRNRLIELAGDDCKFVMMLDDTYRIEGDLRNFLMDVRGDQFLDSLSLYIKSDDVEYSTNRIIKTSKNLKYKYRIHEVIQENNNNNVIIPNTVAYIDDGRFDYMEERTSSRKEFDLKLLFEELEEDPDNPRTYYYLAQTYNLLGNQEMSYHYFIERMNHRKEGFIQEKVDAVFEAARKANFSLNKPWSVCEELYLKAYDLDKTRPDSLYFLGIHYYLENNRKVAFDYFKRGFELGYPVHCQYGLKPTLTYHFLPKFLTELCYDFGDYKLGERSSKFFLENNKPTDDSYEIQLSWHNIYVKLNLMNEPINVEINTDLPLLCFVADGGFEPWTGADIMTKGVGGSETYIIEMARHIQRQYKYKVVVFCNCLEASVFEDVNYIPINAFMPFAKKVKIDTCIISRFTEYVPVAINGLVDNIYIVLHDLTPSGVVIPMSEKLKQIFCLSEWHVAYFLERFPMFKAITSPFYYGIDVNKFSKNQEIQEKEKVPYKFIYSSFPNRGLLQLLQMWPKIVNKYPKASLHIYADIDGKWVNSVEKPKMNQIRQLLNYYKEIKTINIFYHGWVNKSVLAEAWKTAEYWLYPCTFMETFCLTAVEAALSKTLCITNGLAALQNTVANRGVCVEGDATTMEWQDKALKELFLIMENKEKREKLIEINYEWASKMSWENQAKKLVREHFSNEKVKDERKFTGKVIGKVVDDRKVVDGEVKDGGLLNWTHDLPSGTNAKRIFENILKYASNSCLSKEPKVLEIGTYAGTSLISIINNIPNSQGTAIDTWVSYDEINKDKLKNKQILNESEIDKSLNTLKTIHENRIEDLFYSNVNAAGLQNRIKGIKGDSKVVLLDLVKQAAVFDFIYVDGSHKCLDVALDLFLSWQLLRTGGVMAIDDYLYSLEADLETNVLEYPYHAVNHFLELHKNEFIVLEKGYRVFLQKSTFGKG
jgi:predicted O-methyltransferase YrrM